MYVCIFICCENRYKYAMGSIAEILDTVFFEPPFGGLGVTYDVHRRLVGKRVVEFLLVLVKRFCYTLRLRRYDEKYI